MTRYFHHHLALLGVLFCLFLASLTSAEEVEVDVISEKSDSDEWVVVALTEAKIIGPELSVAADKAFRAQQATGAPNVFGLKDDARAWSPATANSEGEWLELEYDDVVTLDKVIVHETFSPGAMTRIVAFTKSGMEAEIWTGQDPARIHGVAVVDGLNINTDRIRVYFANNKVAGFNQVDAVGIIDDKGKKHWATSATASSTYDFATRKLPPSFELTRYS